MQRAVVSWPQPLTQNQVRRLHHYTEAATKKRMHLQARAAYRPPEPLKRTLQLVEMVSDRVESRSRGA
jgi:hypothetical protein